MIYKRHLIKAADIEDIRVKWMWNPYIAYGKLTLLHGPQGVGKTMFLMRLMAAATNYKSIDDCGGHIDPCNVLYLTNEENLEGIVRPRLKQADVDVDRVFIINDELPITLADDSIEALIKENKIRLLIIDPITAYLEREKDFQNNPERVYPIVKKLSEIAERTGCAIVVSAESPGFMSHQSKVWQFVFESDVVSYLCMEDDENGELAYRTLYHERSMISMEGLPVEYVIRPHRGMDVNI
ncbi:MAG: AAA family ATPase [Eubacteriales bacterium]|nr:AAA family ATPase [Eubacteriales bacterium]